MRQLNICVVGLGLIGGSFALNLKRLGFVRQATGVDASAKNAQRAVELGIVDKTAADLAAGMQDADLIVLATPVDTLPMIAVKALNAVKPHQIIMDAGSTKGELCEIIALHPNRGRFVATHPMWGTENSGPDAALEVGFSGRTAVICEAEKSDPDALALIEGIYTALDMPIKHMTAEDQDLHTAYVSHISHVTSYALALTVLEKEREEETIFDLAGGGFESTARLAKSPASMWAPIFKQNKYNVLDVLREHIHQLQILRRMIERDEYDQLYAALEKANTIRRILK